MYMEKRKMARKVENVFYSVLWRVSRLCLHRDRDDNMILYKASVLHEENEQEETKEE